jgi:hypothetical protein
MSSDLKKAKLKLREASKHHANAGILRDKFTELKAKGDEAAVTMFIEKHTC